MSNRAATYLIMTFVAFIIICGILLAHPALGARGCLDRAEATRTWPTKRIAIDADGCFTFLRTGVLPAQDDLVSAPARAAVEAEIIGLDMLQRWPTELLIEPSGTIKHAEPAMMSTRDVVTVILVMILTCGVFEVAFGGFWVKRGRKYPRLGPDV